MDLWGLQKADPKRPEENSEAQNVAPPPAEAPSTGTSPTTTPAEKSTEGTKTLIRGPLFLRFMLAPLNAGSPEGQAGFEKRNKEREAERVDRAIDPEPRDDEEVVIKIDFDRTPEAATHLLSAIVRGISNEGIIDKAGADDRRKKNTRGHPTEPGKDRDEAPPAVMNTGSRVSVRLIDLSDNRRAGADIRKQIRTADGKRARIVPINIPKNQ